MESLRPPGARGRQQWPLAWSLLELDQKEGDVQLAGSTHYQGRVSVRSVRVWRRNH